MSYETGKLINDLQICQWYQPIRTRMNKIPSRVIHVGTFQLPIARNNTNTSHSLETAYWFNTGNTRMHPKVSGLVAWNEKCKSYSFLPRGAVVSIFCESVFWVLLP